MTPPQTPPVCCRCGNPLPEVWFFTADGTGRAACPNCATDEEKRLLTDTKEEA